MADNSIPRPLADSPEKRSCAIQSWEQFARDVRSGGCSLLRRLPDFPDAILVTGCQRSGTTILSRVITRSAGMANFWFGRDDELDAALILSGAVPHSLPGRHCFQTTYLNECYGEYREAVAEQKVIWVLRNPRSVVHSFINNWGRFAFNELFRDCGTTALSSRDRKRYDVTGRWGMSRLVRACYSFNAKVSQLFTLKEHLSEDQLLVVEYDDLVGSKTRVLPEIYGFIDLPYDESYADLIHGRSVGKSVKLGDKQRRLVDELCGPVYTRAAKLVSIRGNEAR